MALVGSRNLDPPEDAYIAEVGLALGSEGVERALDGAAAVYVAIDADGLDPGEGVAAFFPEPAGLTLADVEVLLLRIAAAKPIVAAPASQASSPSRRTSGLFTASLCCPGVLAGFGSFWLGRSGGP